MLALFGGTGTVTFSTLVFCSDVIVESFGGAAAGFAVQLQPHHGPGGVDPAGGARHCDGEQPARLVRG